MRALSVILGAVALLIGVAAQPASAGKGTDIEGFVKQVGKFAVDDHFTLKPKGLCVCQDGSGAHSFLGALVYDGQVGDFSVIVRCWVRVFDTAGSLASVDECETFEILSK